MSRPPLPAGVGALSARWLFSEHFLAERLPEWAEFNTLDVRDLHAALAALWEEERSTLILTPNEGVTEERFIRPVLRLLGHAFTLFAEIPGTGKTPDYFLYGTDGERDGAERAGPVAKVERADAVADAKRFDLPLDRRAPEGDPVAQIREYVYLSKRPFGILTNGRIWRLYARDAPLVERATHEIDLVRLLEDGDPNDLRYFAAFFGARAFRPGPDGLTLPERALDDSALHTVEISSALEGAVFGAVPAVGAGLLGSDPRTREALDAAFANSLVFLYRVLFCLYAEARDLLPIGDADYRRYSVADHRLDVARLIDQNRPLSTSSDALYAALAALFRMIDQGDPALGVTEYDGGLFASDAHPWLDGRFVPDDALAPALDSIYRVGGSFVDYRDLSVRALGAVYERLLAWELVERDGELVLAESPRRHETGSYFTPEAVVDSIVERTLDPLVSRRSEEIRTRGIRGADALEELVGIRVLDPAIGSGHFLVGAAEFLAQAIATEPSYDGGLSLDDLKRLVAEQCLYGVDLNPLAVELARLSLWLVTAREGEPLTFLGNLRVGDSLIGADNETLLDPTTGLLEAHIAASAGELLRQVNEINRRATHTGADAREKRRLADLVEGLRLPLEVFAEQSIERFGPPAGRPRLHWPLEFPEVFVDERGEPLEGGGFDAVLGNPPYIRVQEIGRDVADYCRARFQTPKGSFDAYLVFIERGLSLLAPGGRLGFIVPNKVFKLEFAEKLRAWLSEAELVESVLDFGSSQLFAGVTNYTCIVVFDRGGVPELSYRRLRGARKEVLAELAAGNVIPAQRFASRSLGADPWVLVPPEEAAVIQAASDGAERLDAVTTQIFQGLITGADDVYVVEDRGLRGGSRVVWSRASQREVELEPDLLRPMASGVDVDRYAFLPLRTLLLFPYKRYADEMRLLSLEELATLRATHAYLEEHERRLRGREGGRMDRDGWYAFSRTQNLGAHDSPKLGVAATVRRLEVAADMEAVIHFHNVRVNGILADGVSLPVLLLVLNTRLLDWIFRRGSVDHANDYFAANKQFIAGLPIKIPTDTEARDLESRGTRLHQLATSVLAERGGFFDWLADTVGGARGRLPGQRELDRYERRTGAEVVALLARGGARLTVDPRERAIRELIEREHHASVERLLPLRDELELLEAEADDVVYELYGLPQAMRDLVNSEYV